MILSTPWLWAIFSAIMFTLLYLDLHVFHRHAAEPKFSDSIKVCLSFITIALLFGLFVWYERGSDVSFLFYTGYLVELSLSMDNIFVISLIFTSLSIPNKYQHRVLFWGILGAIVLRAVMIFLGAQLVENFHWILYVFSVFLIFTGLKLLLSHDKEQEDFKDTKLYQFIAQHFRFSKKIYGENFFIKKRNKHYATPLLLALILIELMDVVFAVDSIPAIFLITQDTFVVYTSNIFAILGLRSLYFLLAAATKHFAFLKHALSIILIFIGLKIFAPFLGFHVSSLVSMIVTFTLLGSGVLASVLIPQKTK